MGCVDGTSVHFIFTLSGGVPNMVVGDQLSSGLCKGVIIPYLKNLIVRQGNPAELEIDYYDSLVPIIQAENHNFCQFSIVIGRVEIRHNGVRLIDDSHRILGRLDYSTDESAMRTLTQLVNKFLILKCISNADDGEAWFSNYTSWSVEVSKSTVLTSAKI